MVWRKVRHKAAVLFCNVDYTQISSHPTAVRILRDAEKVGKDKHGRGDNAQQKVIKMLSVGSTFSISYNNKMQCII